MINLSFLRNNRWGKKATQEVCVPLFFSEGESLVEVWISNQSIPTKSRPTVSHSFIHSFNHKQEKLKIIKTSFTHSLTHLPGNRDTPWSHTLILRGLIFAVHVPDAAPRGWGFADRRGSPICLFIHHKAAVSFAAARSWSATRHSRWSRTPPL